ncbi:hypothetical protein Leryth_001674 [Lithospermum erythrorhizon]|nr:hypothetical protein Leryth_001674 [Lithospermum erythrorhizon]
MADSNSTPLLTNLDSTKKPTNIVNDNSVDNIIEFYMGALRSPQIMQVILISFSCFFEAQQTFISIFTDAKPTWHCLESPCNQESNICELKTSAWSYDNAHASIISEWSLQCVKNSIVIGLPASCFFMGCILGGLILFLVGDSFGRKFVLSLSCFMMSVASICCAFAGNVWTYSASRFISGFGRAAIGTCSLVLATESVGKKWQGQVGTVSFLMSTLGFLSLSIIAYFNRNYSWRVLYVVTSLPGIVYCLLIQFCVYESPRWLFSQGKERQAFAVLSTFAGIDLSSTTDQLGDILLAKGNTNASKKEPFFKMLVESTKFLKQFLLALVVGLGIGITYYGVPLGIGNLDSNLYLNSAFNALIEIPSVLLTLLTISKWKRRYFILGLCTLGGCCGILSYMLKNWNGIVIVMEMITLFCACTAYDVILIYTSELFPTCFRNSAVSTVWQAVVLGGVISPVVNAAFESYIRLLPYGIFGVVLLSFGTLVILLPETLGVSTSEDSV